MTVRNTALSIEGVETASVHFPQNLLEITYISLDPQLTYAVAIAIENSGYTVEWGNGISIVYLTIGGMFCNHCVGTVHKALVNLIGVKSANVDLNRHIATVVIDAGTNLATLIDAVESVGYDAAAYEGSRDVYLSISGMVSNRDSCYIQSL